MNTKKFFRIYGTVVKYGAITVASILVLIFGIYPLLTRTLNMADQQRTLSSDVAALQKKTAILNVLDEQALRDDIFALTTAIPPDKSLATVLYTVDTVSAQNGVAVADLTLQRPGSIATGSAAKRTADEARLGSNLLEFSITVKGSFEQIKSFINNLQAVRRMFRVRTLTMTFTEGELNANSNVYAYYSPLVVVAPGALEPISPLSDDDLKTIAAVNALPLASGVSAAPVVATVPSGNKTDPFAH